MRLHGTRHTFTKGNMTVTLCVWSNGDKTLTLTRKNNTSLTMEFTAKEWTDLSVTAWDMTDELEKAFKKEQKNDTE